jgi:hypothetical protein
MVGGSLPVKVLAEGEDRGLRDEREGATVDKGVTPALNAASVTTIDLGYQEMEDCTRPLRQASQERQDHGPGRRDRGRGGGLGAR